MIPAPVPAFPVDAGGQPWMSMDLAHSYEIVLRCLAWLDGQASAANAGGRFPNRILETPNGHTHVKVIAR